MDKIVLMKAQYATKKEIEDYIMDYKTHGENHINGSSSLMDYSSIEEWKEDIINFDGKVLTEDNTFATTYFSIRESDHKIIGSIQLRHQLTPSLMVDGGNIGYEIRPSERNKGYGVEQLKLVLEEAKKLGLKQVVLTCFKDNLGSRNTIVACKGKIMRKNMFENKPHLHYKIKL